jgi:hypothetical protein
MYNPSKVSHRSCKQAAAGLLISGILWTFCSCLLFCGDAACGDEISGAKAGLVFVHETDSDACPVNVSAKAAPAERPDFGASAFDVTLRRQTFTPKKRNDSPRHGFFAPRFIFADPPLERLPVLRI